MIKLTIKVKYPIQKQYRPKATLINSITVRPRLQNGPNGTPAVMHSTFKIREIEWSDEDSFIASAESNRTGFLIIMLKYSDEPHFMVGLWGVRWIRSIALNEIDSIGLGAAQKNNQDIIMRGLQESHDLVVSLDSVCMIAVIIQVFQEKISKYRHRHTQYDFLWNFP